MEISSLICSVIYVSLDRKECVRYVDMGHTTQTQGLSGPVKRSKGMPLVSLLRLHKCSRSTLRVS